MKTTPALVGCATVDMLGPVPYCGPWDSSGDETGALAARQATVLSWAHLLALGGAMHRLSQILGLSLTCVVAAYCSGGGGTTSPPATSIATVTVAPAADTTIPGQTVSFTATPLDASGHKVENKSFTWTSSNTGVATVGGGSTGANGNPIVATTVAVGSTTITATSEGKSGSAQLVANQASTAVTGRVIDFTTQAGIANATVIVDRNGTTLGSTTTAADGSFTAGLLQRDAAGGSVLLLAQATGYVGGNVLANVVADATTPGPTIPLAPASSLPGGINGTVRDATTGNGIPGAGVILYNTLGYVNAGNTTADGSGAFSFTGLAAGTYDLVASASGYSQANRYAVAVGNNGVTSGQDAFLSPESGANVIRIVLTWGADPPDLDSHLTGPNADTTRFHVWFNNRLDPTMPPYAGLDHDVTTGYGPESITITRFNSGNYRYSVHDFTDKDSSSSSRMGNSGAKVVVYDGGSVIQTFYVPNQPGTLWTVFEMTGDIAFPTITVRNEMGYASDPASIQSHGGSVASRGTDAALIGRTMHVKKVSKPPTQAKQPLRAFRLPVR
jgi:hypothetical protein